MNVIFLVIGITLGIIAVVVQLIRFNKSKPSQQKWGDHPLVIALALTAALITILAFTFSSPVGVAIIPTPTATTSPTAPLPTATPTSTHTPTPSPVSIVTPTSTHTPTPSPVSIVTPIIFNIPQVYDFEQNTQGWGEHPQDEGLNPGQGVRIYCDRQVPIRYSGDCSLQFDPLVIKENNAYVTVYKDVQETIIIARVYVPLGAEVCSSQACSTAKIIIWDQEGNPHESDLVELSPGSWVSVSWDLRGKAWTSPRQEFGIHFYLLSEYKGPIYIDTVTIDH